MKSDKRKKKLDARLQLVKTTIRTLQPRQLREAGGGYMARECPMYTRPVQTG